MADPFEAELERLVSRFARDLAHEVTALILGRLGIERAESRSLVDGRRRSAPSPASAAGAGGASRAPEKRRAAAPPRAKPETQVRRRQRPTREQRAATTEQVANAVAARSSMNVGELEHETGLSRTIITSALKTLKQEGRVFMGGTKRFARYAVTQAAADQASLDARGSAAG
jgi:hypothetical protein